jgi:FkbM family methyltransferase
MLLDIKETLDLMGITVRGIIHIGAHLCEEIDTYKKWNVHPNNVIWIDANETLVEQNRASGIPNLYCAALDEITRTAEFRITNNGQSSSLLELGTHADDYPHIVVVETRTVNTTTLPEFLKGHRLTPTDYNLWNLDIQGVELQVLRGASILLDDVDAIYTEVNSQEVYKGAGLISEIDSLLANHGFKRVLTYMTSAGWGDALYVRLPPPPKI